MNILYLNMMDARGGATVMARRLRHSVENAGHHTTFVAGFKIFDEPEIIGMNQWTFPVRLKRRIRGLIEELTGYQYFFCPDIDRLDHMGVLKDVDLVHLHISHGGYIHFNIIAQLAARMPVVWTLHDMWAFTGHCAHSFECDRFEIGCGECPHLETYPHLYRDTTKMLLEKKKSLYEKSRDSLHLVSPSKWLINKSRSSIIKDLDLTWIPNAVGTDVFFPQDKIALRKEFGIPLKSFVVCFVSDWGTKDSWKGFPFLLNALRMLKIKGHNPYLLVIGDKDQTLSSTELKGQAVGRVKSEAMMARYYSVSDVYLLSSIAENSPLVVIEALACGIPVVGFDVGGVSELVQHKVNGYLSPKADAEGLAQGLTYFMKMDHADYLKACAKAHGSVKESHNMKTHTESYLRLYKRILLN